MALSLTSRSGTCLPARSRAVESSKLRQLYAPSIRVNVAQAHQPSSLATSQSSHTLRRSVAVAARGSSSEPWWEKDTAPNMKQITTVQELVDNLADAGDRLVIVDIYAKWCNACRALYPKLCKLMREHPDVVLLKVDFEDNRQMCKTLGVKVLPFFLLYRGAEGKVDSFSCSVSKLQRMRDALDNYDTPFCSLEAMPGLEEFPEVQPHADAGSSSAAAAPEEAAQPAALASV